MEIIPLIIIIIILFGILIFVESSKVMSPKKTSFGLFQGILEARKARSLVNHPSCIVVSLASLLGTFVCWFAGLLVSRLPGLPAKTPVVLVGCQQALARRRLPVCDEFARWWLVREFAADGAVVASVARSVVLALALQLSHVGGGGSRTPERKGRGGWGG